ncbi:hypothetical protein NDU88_007707, partial [Pleurodeles waltl]
SGGGALRCWREPCCCCSGLALLALSAAVSLVVCSASAEGRSTAAAASSSTEHGDGARLLHLQAALRCHPLHDRVRRLQGLVPRQ